MAKRPARYFIEYSDPVKFSDPDYEPSYDDCIQKNAPNLPLARRLASATVARFNTSVGIYERINMEQIDPPWGPWWFETDLVEEA